MLLAIRVNQCRFYKYILHIYTKYLLRCMFFTFSLFTDASSFHMALAHYSRLLALSLGFCPQK